MEKNQEKNLKKAFADCDKFYAASRILSEESGLEKLKNTLLSYRGVSPSFNEYIRGEGVFQTAVRYVPVYCSHATAEYLWGRKSQKEENGEVVHKEERSLTKTAVCAFSELKADEILSDKLEELSSPPEEVYPDREFRIPLKERKKELKTAAKEVSPVRGAEWTLQEERYECIFVPVLEAVCEYEGVPYTGRVNLHGGTVAAEYPLSKRVKAEAEKTLQTAKTAKTYAVFAGVFILAFAALALLEKLVAETPKGSIMSVCIQCLLMVFPVLAYAKCKSYRREKLLHGATVSGSVPKATWAAVLAGLSILAAACAFGYFAVTIIL